MTAAVPDPRFRDQLAEAIATVENSRQTHVRWIDYLRLNPSYEPGLVGDLEHHEQCVREYDNVLAVLRSTEVGRCGDEAPSMVGGAVEWCRLPAGHLGWHRGDNGSEWTHRAAALASPALAPRAEKEQADAMPEGWIDADWTHYS